MAVFTKFEDMEIWQDGRKLVGDIYRLSSSEAWKQDRSFRDQICRAAVSVCSNIAEGYARRGNKELVNFLWIAKGSAAEVQSQLYHALDIGYVSQRTFDLIYADLHVLQSKMYRLIQALSTELKKRRFSS